MPIVARKQLNSARKVIGKLRNVIIIGTPPRLIKTSPTGASGGAVTAPILTEAVPVRELVGGVARKRPFESAKAYAESRPHAPGEAAARIIVVEGAAILDGHHGGRRRHGTRPCAKVGRLGYPRRSKEADRNCRENNVTNHRSLLVWRVATI